MLGTTSLGAGEWDNEIPPELARSPLLAAGGYRVITGLIDDATLDGLLEEALAVRPQATRGVVEESDGTEGRGGNPARAFRSGPGRQLHWRLHGCAEMAEALTRICGVPVAATGGGTYSYYETAGDFLALHRDVVRCDVAVITCLSLRLADDSAGGLYVYPDRLHEPLSKIRAAGRAAGRTAPLGRGQTIVLFGGILPHEVTPMAAGQERIVSVMCYKAQIGDQLAPSSLNT